MSLATDNDLTVTIGGEMFGFAESVYSDAGAEISRGTACYLGPFGAFHVPFSAWAGLLLATLLLVAMIVAAIALVQIRRRPHPA